MGVVSPITAVLAASIPVIIGVVRGERLSALQMGGMVIALVAIVLISLSTEEDGRIEFSTTGVKEAIASGVILGGFYTFLALSGKGAGLYPLLGARFGSMGLLLVVALLLRRSIVPARATVPTIIAAGAIDMTANALYVLATFRGYLSIVAVLTSLYPASTVFLARIVLHERLQLQQKLGVLCALAGVVMIAL
jgi:drug/metabolite transporter (DMT)-like permease